jgi:hypothetical protein
MLLPLTSARLFWPVSSCGQKNVLSLCAQDAFGSPPPELPNHALILCLFGRSVNVTSVMQSPENK